jgi:hypothetical protein
MKDAQVVQGFGEAGGDFERRSITRHGGVGVTAGQQRIAQIVMGDGVIGRHGKRPAIMSRGVAVLAQLLKDIAQVDVGLGETRIQLDGAAKGCFGIGKQAAGIKRRTKIVVELGPFRRQLDSLAKSRQGIVVVAKLGGDQTAIAQGIGVVGVDSENIIVAFQGLGEIAGAMQRHGTLHRDVDDVQRRRAQMVRFVLASALQQSTRLSVHGSAAAVRFP